MTDPRDDSDLRALFQELRKMDMGRSPSFRQVMAGTQAGHGPGETRDSGPGSVSRFRLRLLGRARWIVPLAAAAALVLLLLPGRGTSEAEFDRVVRAFMVDPAGGAWQSPTDALLRVPGSEVLSTRPRLDGAILPLVSGTGSRSVSW